MSDYQQDANGSGAPDSHAASAPTIDPSVGNVDKIREILFGAQMREYETRFRRLEETLLRESAELRDSSRKRFDALEGYLKNELEALQGRLKAERDERSDSGRNAAREIKELGESLSKRLSDLDEKTFQAHRELRNGILEQSKQLGEEAARKHEEMLAHVERRFSELHHDKTDRAALAAMLNELALRLTDEFKVAGADV